MDADNSIGNLRQNNEYLCMDAGNSIGKLRQNNTERTSVSYQKAENIELWQSLHLRVAVRHCFFSIDQARSTPSVVDSSHSTLGGLGDMRSLDAPFYKKFDVFCACNFMSYMQTACRRLCLFGLMN
jgi:hypothetical protein